MARLNIPFSRTHRKIRHARRVFLVLTLGIVGFWALSWKLTDTWFTRNTIFLAAPVGTMAEIRFTPGEKEWKELSDYFGDTSLISGRSITLKDIQPITNGEFAVFIGEDGRTTVAIRSKNIPKELLDSLGIVVQSPSKTVFLLSDRILPLQTNTRPPLWIRNFFSLRDGEIRIFDTESEKSTLYPVRLSKDTLSIRLNGEKTVASPWKHLPNNTLLSLSTPEWTEDSFSTGISKISQIWGKGVQEIFVPALIETSQKAPFFLWRGSGEGKPLLLSGTSSQSTSDIQNLLRILASASEPKTRDFSLSDGSVVKEWYTDPSLITIETLTRGGVPVYRAVGNTSTYFAAQKDGKFVFTNTELALGMWLGEKTSEEKPSSCTHALFFDLKAYKKQATEALQLNTPNLFETLVFHLPYLRVEAGKNPWMIFSKDMCG